MTPTPRRRQERVDTHVGPGEFRGAHVPSFDALGLFFEAIRTQVPTVFTELDQVSCSRPVRNDKIWPFILRDRDYEADPDPAVDAWASTHGLGDPHSLTIVRASVYGWATGNLPRESWQVGLFAPQPEFPPLENPVWNPRWETEAAFRERVDAYIHGVAGAEYARGAERTVSKRSRGEESGTRHFAWLACYVVGHETLQSIANRYSRSGSEETLTPSTVWYGIRSAASLACITLPAR